MKKRHFGIVLITAFILFGLLTSCGTAISRNLPSQNELTLTQSAPSFASTPIINLSLEKSSTVKPDENYSKITGIKTASPEQIATDTQSWINRSDINLASKGKTFTFGLTQRFFVFLDDEKYPATSLRCKPNPVIGAISNGFFRGPDHYPAYFEATRVGSCTLQNGDFFVTIIVINPWASATPFPANATPYPQ